MLVNRSFKMKSINFSKRELLRYVGDAEQVFGIKDYILSGGKAKGVRAFDIRNGSGLEFTVLADRGLDIAAMSVHGINCSYRSKTGIVAPEYYEESVHGFLRSFSAGFLTTCGLRNVGNPCREAEETFGQHGRISSIPGEEVGAKTEWMEGIPVFTVSGKMREARVFGEHLVFHRKISCRYGENRIRIQNTVENMGFKSEQVMVLFHFNLGYPLLDEGAILLTSTKRLIPRDPEAVKGEASFSRCQKPTPGYAEQVFYHNLRSDEAGNTCAALINPDREIGVAIHFNKKQLFNFTQWKQMGEGEYVMGMEPCNCYVGGRTDPRNEGIVEYLEPGEVRNFDLTIDVLSGRDEIAAITREIAGYRD